MLDDKVLDLSHYDFYAVDSTGKSTWNAKCLYSSGVRNVIIATYQKQVARQMINDCLNAGIRVIGLYGLVYFGTDSFYVHRDTNHAIDLAKEFGIDTIWVDCEIDAKDIGVNSPAPYPAQRVGQILSVVNKIQEAGLKVGIYTAQWWWPSRTNNYTGLSHLPLWNAYYTQTYPVFDVNYGGWKKCDIHQYTSTKVICGRGRDHNYMNVGEPEITEDDMTREETEALIKEYFLKYLFKDEERMKFLDQHKRLETRVNDIEDVYLDDILERLQVVEEATGIAKPSKFVVVKIGDVEYLIPAFTLD